MSFLYTKGNYLHEVFMNEYESVNPEELENKRVLDILGEIVRISRFVESDAASHRYKLALDATNIAEAVSLVTAWRKEAENSITAVNALDTVACAKAWIGLQTRCASIYFQLGMFEAYDGELNSVYTYAENAGLTDVLDQLNML